MSLAHRVKFIGRIHPAGLKLDIKIPPTAFIESSGKFAANFVVSVTHSVVEVDCNFDNFQKTHPYPLWEVAQRIVEGYVNLAAFQMGAGAISILDNWIDENGRAMPLALQDPALVPLCTAFGQDHRYDHAVKTVFSEPSVAYALHDLVLSNVNPAHVLINCARAVEGIRHAIAGPTIERGEAWGIMQDTLHFDRAYRTMITDNSIAPRHGQQDPVADGVTEEIRCRSWIIMDRFLHYRMTNCQALPMDRFPLLKG